MKTPTRVKQKQTQRHIKASGRPARQAAHPSAKRARRRRLHTAPRQAKANDKPHTAPSAHQKKELFVFRDDRRYRISFRTLFTIMLIFIGCLATALTYAYIGDTQLKISQARAQLQTQKEANAALRAEITQKYTLDEVARIAVERLGMNKPDASQIIYINVPMQSYVLLNDGDEAPEPESLWAIIQSFFMQFVE